MRAHALVAVFVSVLLILEPSLSGVASASSKVVKSSRDAVVSIPPSTRQSVNLALAAIAKSADAPTPAPTQPPETPPAPVPSATPSPAPKHDNTATYVIVGIIVVAAIILASQSRKSANSINLSGVQVQGKPELGFQVRFR